MLCAGGPALQDLKKRAKGMRNIDFLPLQPVERCNDLHYLADNHLLPQRADASGYVIPSEVEPMTASGRPVVVTAEKSSDVRTMISIGGGGISPDNSAELSRAIIELAMDKDKRDALGENGRTYAEEYWAIKKCSQKSWIISRHYPKKGNEVSINPYPKG